ncbi:MAG TPA: TrkH family potassium uptake protein [Candidatus Mcinerneyibacterium sp.]|nr:TrkH family potassium uptake protein [Candidatus Mcinerneyibacterium sp.]
MDNNKFERYFDIFLFIASFLLIILYLIDYGFYLNVKFSNSIIYASYFVLFFYIIEIALNFHFTDNIKKEFLNKKIPYIITFLMLFQYILLKTNFFNIFFEEQHNYLFYVIITKLYILYIFFYKFSKLSNVIIPKTKLKSGEIFILSFIVIIMIGTFLLMMPRATVSSDGISFVDSLFTSTSAVCVTGLIVVDTATYFTRFGQIIILVLLQIGGLGLMTFTSFFSIFFFRKMTIREKFMMSHVLNYDSIGDVQKIISKILIITFSFEFIGAVSLYFRFKNYFKDTALTIFHSIFQSVSAFCNAGFSTFTTSLERFSGDIGINLTVAGLIIVGGLGFLVLLELFNSFGNEVKLLSIQAKLVLTVTVVLIFLGTIFIYILESNNLLMNLPVKEKILASFFQSVTTRTAGFNTISTGNLTMPVLFMMIFLMFVGASPGSTGGGIKTTTFGLLIATIWSTIKGKRDVELFNRRISKSLIYRVISLVFISIMFVFAIFLVLLITENFSIQDTLFELISAFGTVGLSTGITSSLSTVGKVAITVTMFVGRLGPITLALALSTQEKKVNVQYPKESSIMVG